MDEERRNLKGNEDELVYYRTVDTGSLERRLKLIKNHENEEVEAKVYYYPEQNRIKFTENEVRKFSLDSYGESIPYIDGELTIFNNYLFDFWGYYLNAEGLALYGHLKRYAYGKKDWCFPNFELISLKMDKSRPTLLNYMELLEHYGFAFKLNVVNKSRHGVEESPIFKLRKKVPLLTEKLIYGNPDLEIPADAPKHIQKALKKEQKGLPVRLRKEHEKYVKSMIDSSEKVHIEKDIDFEEIYKQWEHFGEIIERAKKAKSKPTSLVNREKEMDEAEKMLLNLLKSYVSNKISKPSFDTWFRDILLKKDQKSVIILAPNEFTKDWLENKYNDILKEALKTFDEELTEINIQVI
ncbi:DnaA N-terminal domain-containing protein [Cytobacillus pseudoceanisediminis]|uniref:DnaA N-terminal domain-containing protein n=1 Tax=Cytobacillus pseudoceanisediminis TaxID=3051614 RepID=UPI00366941DB